MSFSIACSSCTARLRVPESALGKTKRCPRCGNAIFLAGAADPPGAGTTPTSGVRDAQPAHAADAAAAKPRRSPWRKVALVCAGLALLPFVMGMLLFVAGLIYALTSSTPNRKAIGETKSPSVPFADSGKSKTALLPPPPPPVSRPVVFTPSAAPKPAPIAPAPRPVSAPPVRQPSPVVVVPAQDARRQFLRQEIARLQAAIQTDNKIIQQNTIAAPALRLGGEFLAALIKNSKNPNDVKYGPYVTPIVTQGGQELGSMADQARAQAQARVNANQLLLHQHQAELSRFGG